MTITEGFEVKMTVVGKAVEPIPNPKAALAAYGRVQIRTYFFFLHEWRRCVCRKTQVTLIELNRDTKEIRAWREQSTNNKTKTNPTKTKPTHKKTKTGFIRAVKPEATVVKER